MEKLIVSQEPNGSIVKNEEKEEVSAVAKDEEIPLQISSDCSESIGKTEKEEAPVKVKEEEMPLQISTDPGDPVDRNVKIMEKAVPAENKEEEFPLQISTDPGDSVVRNVKTEEEELSAKNEEGEIPLQISTDPADSTVTNVKTEEEELSVKNEEREIPLQISTDSLHQSLHSFVKRHDLSLTLPTMPPKKRRIEDDYRTFNEEWTHKYFFMCSNSKAVCLLCQKTIAVLKEYNLRRHYQTKHMGFDRNMTDEERKKKSVEYVAKLNEQQTLFEEQSTRDTALEASFMVAHQIARRNKPFSDGEFIKQCMVDCANVVCPEMKDKFENISLSKRTVMRHIEIINEELTQRLRDASRDFVCYSLALDESTDLQDTAQLLIFVRGVDENIRITEELLSIQSMKNTTTGQDLYECVVKAIEESGLSWDRFTSITTYGARALHGKNVAIVKLLEDKIRKDNPNQAFLSFHYILYQENLCKSGLNLKHVLDPVLSVVNTIRASALNHRQFKSLLEDKEAEHGDVLYHNNVRWLSLGKVLKRVWELRKEILLFLNMKGITCEFVTKMDCDEWKYELMFVAELFEKLNELNVKLQGKELMAHEMYKHVKDFQANLSLFSRQASEGKFTHFSLLEKEKVPANVCSKIKDQLTGLNEEFERRFEDFRQIDPQFNLLTSPFSAHVDAAPDELQLELIDIQSDHSLKEMFHSLPLVEFYKSLSVQCFPCIRHFAARLFSIFGSTYICEQSFSCMKINKSNNRCMVSDINLNAVMRVSTSNLVPDFKRIVQQNCDQQHLSH